MSNDVTFQRPEYEAALPRWELVSDCCAGQEAIKAKTTTYLPKPNPLDTSPKAQTRYDNYLMRAVFYNATGRTLTGLRGLAFRKVPVLTVPDSLKYVEDDIDGAGLSIYQQSQSTLDSVNKSGRYGLLTDYPQTDGNTSKSDMEKKGIRATVAAYEPQSIINWRTAKVGGLHKLSLVVLSEMAEVETDDGFGIEKVQQYRVLKLVDGIYWQELYQAGKDGVWALAQDPYAPKDGRGKLWDEIPFQFVGASNNDTSVDAAPLYDLAEINIAHYRNSAEYEDSIFMCGQIQPVASGVDENWVEVLKKHGIEIGSRTLFPLPQGAQFSFEQAESNPLAAEGMKHKESQMIALGAQLLSEDGTIKTATESDNDNSQNTSVLALVCSNVSEAYSKCLMWMARFMGVSGEALYEINQDFVVHRLDSQLLTALVAAWQSGALPKPDLWAQLRKYGLIDPEKTDEELKDEIEADDTGLNLDSEDPPVKDDPAQEDPAQEDPEADDASKQSAN